MKLDPLTRKKIKRFCSIKRGFYAFLIFVFMLVSAIFAELWVNSRALFVHYQGKYYFPAYGQMISGNTFKLGYAYETNYRELQKKFEEEGGDNFVILPLVPFDPYELDLPEGKYPPFAPSIKSSHYLGTDAIGRDMIARLVYGFRICITYSLLLLIVTFSIGITLGSLMGYLGGKFDLFFQRIIEIWSSIPFLYIIMIIASILVPNLMILVIISVVFGWMSMTWYMRTTTYKEKARDYVMAVRALGASSSRIIFHHILPNSVSLIVTFIPFSIAGGISALTGLDYFGFGLPAPTPSWGELLQQGVKHRSEAAWIIIFTVLALVVVMTSVTFIGEAVREAFDPKLHTTFE